MNWVDGLDFSWLGFDKVGNIGSFSVTSDNVPGFVLEKYNEKNYDDLMNFLIYELPDITSSTNSNHWAHYDSDKGLFVFDFDVKTQLYKRVGVPRQAISKDKFGAYEDIIIDISNYIFSDDEEIKLKS